MRSGYSWRFSPYAQRSMICLLALEHAVDYTSAQGGDDARRLQQPESVMSQREPDSETTRVARAYVHSLEKWFSAEAPTQRPVARPSPPSARLVPATVPDLAGCRLMSSLYTDVYLADSDGYLRHIADQETYNRLFRDWSNIIETNVDHIALAQPIGPGTVLVRGFESDNVYIIDQGLRRLIRGPAVMDKYWFNWDRISLMNQTDLECIALGGDWE
jgi:hypothetical protein